MIKQIVSASDPKLRQKSKPISKFDKRLNQIITDLKDTLIAQKNPEGVGLAAPQIGKNVRVFVVRAKKSDPISVYINPVILKQKTIADRIKKKDNTLEGCLSLPNFYGPLKRDNYVKLKFKNEKGESVTKEFFDFDAQIILHEMDHLNGIIFVDRLLASGKPLYEYKNGDWNKVDF